MKSQLLIPEKLKVGFQSRTDTYTKEELKALKLKELFVSLGNGKAKKLI